MAEVPHKKALSGKLLTMKFMQRQLEKENREKLEQEQVRVITEAHWVLDQKSIDLPKPKFQVEYEPSFLQMESHERSNVGRVSFQQFNDAVEKSATQKDKDQQLERELKRQREGEIDDDKMAESYGRHLNPTKKAKLTASGSAEASTGAETGGLSQAGNGTGKKVKTNRRQPPSKPANQSKGLSGGNNGDQPRSFMKPKE
ncbi:M-phase phosphoprotein 6 [Mortierella sp. NVP85]|nr:M-phase phosphoprotein 6 [Mortierella sp. NVP85]